jgi:protein ImuA
MRVVDVRTKQEHGRMRQPATSLPLLRSSADGGGTPAPAPVPFGAPTLDGPLGGGLARAALHEVYAAGGADGAAATGFAAGVALRAAAGGRQIAWIRQDFLDAEVGRLHPPGLAELGLDPGQVLLVRAKDVQGVLRAGLEATRCAVLGAVLIEPWGESRLLDLTASRRLSLAAKASGAATRWLVRSLPSRALEANAPGYPAFVATLLRHRRGVAGREWCLEWDRDRGCFQDRPVPDAAPVPRPVVPVPARRAAAARAVAATPALAVGLRRAG